MFVNEGTRNRLHAAAMAMGWNTFEDFVHDIMPGVEVVISPHVEDGRVIVGKVVDLVQMVRNAVSDAVIES